MILNLALAAVIGAVAFRVRGSSQIHDLLPWLPMAGRIVWSLAMTAAALWLVWNPWLLLLAPAFFLGCILGWRNTLDLGRDGDRRWWIEALIMAGRGVLWTALAGAVLWWAGEGWWFGLAGVVCPLCYGLAWAIPSRIPFLHRGPELGEFLFGAWLGAALALSIAGVP